MFNAPNIIYIATILSVALMAGLFYNWSVAVTPGLGRLNDKAYLQAMQSLNRAILNPGFFIVFLSSIFLLPINAIVQHKSGLGQRSLLFILAAAIYLIGSVGVTFLGNVPLNNQLDVLDLNTLGDTEISQFKASYEGRWNKLNWIRTLSSLAASILLLLPLFIDPET